MFLSAKKIAHHFILFSAIAFSSYIYADNCDYPYGTDEPPAIGNFILPGSQEPGPLAGFGHNLLEAHETQFFMYPTYLKAKNSRFTDIVPYMVYGFDDNNSIGIALPYSDYRETGRETVETIIPADPEDEESEPEVIETEQPFDHHATGADDAVVQFEHAIFQHSTRCYTEYSTFLANVTLPINSRTTQPPISFEQPTVFLAGTYDRTYADWFGFTTDGVQLTMPPGRIGIQYGNSLIYQAGVGRNLFDIGNKWIVAAMVEGTGQYLGKTKINGDTDPNSGGNTVLVIPSLWVSSKHLIVQAGVGVPAVEHLFGEQNHSRYLLIANVGWSVY